MKRLSRSHSKWFTIAELMTRLIISLLFCHNAFAHSISVWAEVNHHQVLVKAYGSDGKLLRRGHVIIKNLNEKRLVEGEIDRDGVFTFIPEFKQDLIIQVILDQGHQGEFWLSEDDYISSPTSGNR